MIIERLLLINEALQIVLKKKQQCDVIKNEGCEEKWERKPLKKEMDNPSFLRRHMADFLRHFVKLPHKLMNNNPDNRSIV